MTACEDMLLICDIPDAGKDALIECRCVYCHIGFINNSDLGIVFPKSLPRLSAIAIWHLQDIVVLKQSNEVPISCLFCMLSK